MLAVEEPMGDHSDFVPVYDRDCPDDMAARRVSTPREGLPNEIPQGFGPATVAFLGDEPVEVQQQRSL
jgi:hypothetical protein